MKRRLGLQILAFALASAGAGILAQPLPKTSPGPERYWVDPVRSYVQFKVTFMDLRDVEGSFHSYDVAVLLDSDDPTRSSVTALIDSKSIYTGVRARDDHLRSDDFFGVDKFPEIRFQSRSVTQSAGRLEVLGELAIHGVKKQVVLPLTMSRNDVEDRVVFKGELVLRRREFGVIGNFWGDKVLSDEVRVQLHLETRTGARYDSGFLPPPISSLVDVFYESAVAGGANTSQLIRFHDERSEAGAVPLAVCRTAIRLRREGRLAAAIKLVRAGLDIVMTDENCWDLLGRLQVENHELDASRETYRHLMGLNPHHAGAIEMTRWLSGSRF